MGVLKCPVCGSDAVDSNQQGTTFSAEGRVTQADDIVVCHCAMSHRFAVALREGILPQPKSGRPLTFPLVTRTSNRNAG